MDDSQADFHSVEGILQEHLPPDKLAHVWRILYGWNCGAPVAELELDPALLSAAATADFDLQAYAFRTAEGTTASSATAAAEPSEAAATAAEPSEGAGAEAAAAGRQQRPRIMRVGVVQHGIVAPTSAPVEEQRQVLCLQEFFQQPFFFCTREPLPWREFAESAEEGPSTRLCQELARKHRMVIITSILERDEPHGGTLWNTSVVISHQGRVLGKHRKNHVTRVGDFNESHYYMEGNTGHPVFETVYGRIAVNICYGRHVPLNCAMFALNGAEVVFNPCATVGELTEPMWAVEARDSAYAFGYFMCGINRVGTEVYPTAFTSGDGRPAHKHMGPFYGSSYVAAPDGSRTPGLGRHRDGLLVADLDLGLCEEVRQRWGAGVAACHERQLREAAEQLQRYVQHGFRPEAIRDPQLGGGSTGIS